MSIDLGPTHQLPQVQAVVPRFWSLAAPNAPLLPARVSASVEQVVCCAPPGVTVHSSVIIGSFAYCEFSSIKALFGLAGAGVGACLLHHSLPQFGEADASLSHNPSLSQTET